jgi:enoyl-CoA hydratase/carnithine racemase
MGQLQLVLHPLRHRPAAAAITSCRAAPVPRPGLIFTGRKVDVTKPWPQHRRRKTRRHAVADAQTWAAELGKGSATALALTKTILNQSFELSAHDVFAQGSQAQGICYTSTEHRESVMAFLAKSAPAAKE